MTSALHSAEMNAGDLDRISQCPQASKMFFWWEKFSRRTYLIILCDRVYNCEAQSHHQGDDAPMGMEDERVAQLEHRMNQLEVNMQQQQHVAASQHAEVQQQLNQVRIQVDQQGASFRSLMDQRFTEQLSEIERIMAKRPKTTE